MRGGCEGGMMDARRYAGEVLAGMCCRGRGVVGF